MNYKNKRAACMLALFTSLLICTDDVPFTLVNKTPENTIKFNQIMHSMSTFTKEDGNKIDKLKESLDNMIFLRDNALLKDKVAAKNHKQVMNKHIQGIKRKMTRLSSKNRPKKHT